MNLRSLLYGFFCRSSKTTLCLAATALLSANGFAGTVLVTNYADTWEWNIPTNDPGTSWRNTTGGWGSGASGSGAGLFGFETASLPYPIQTTVGTINTPPVTYLFRKAFTFSGNPAGATFSIDHIVDDGVTYYLNGSLLASKRHVPGAWNNTADINDAVGDAVEETNVLNGNANGLLNGNNVLSAEVHQVAASGSDLVFGMRMSITSSGTLIASDDWRQVNFGTYNNTGNAADSADPDKDGMANITEFALNKDPNRGNSRWANTALESTNLTATFNRRIAAMSEMTFSVLWSTDASAPIASWNSTGVAEQILSDDGSFQNVKVTVPMSGAAKKFLRLKLVRTNLPDTTITTPVSRIVYQRNNSNVASVPLTGTCSLNVTRVEARAVVRTAGQGTTTNWVTIDSTVSGGSFHGTMPVTGGWYNIEVRAVEGFTTGPVSSISRVGVGEVFAIAGHSVAHGQDINIEGATDDRVNTVVLDKASANHTTYKQTGNQQYLPTAYGHFGDGVVPAPFGNGTYFWSKFGQHLVDRLNVPVLIFNAGFGGTSLEHWAKASQGIYFDHGFVNATIRMPYINLYNVLIKYAPKSGIRAVLADQGQNDNNELNQSIIVNNYKTWVNQARTDLSHPQLAIIVNRQTPFHDDPPQARWTIRQAQLEMISTHPYCYTGPDYDLMVPADRPDQIHLGALGEYKAATWWADAITNTTFLSASTPWLPVF